MATASYNKYGGFAEVTTFDGTQVDADAIVASFNGLASVQIPEDAGGDAVLAIIQQEGTVLNAYANDLIVVEKSLGTDGVESINSIYITNSSLLQKYFVLQVV